MKNRIGLVIQASDISTSVMAIAETLITGLVPKRLTSLLVNTSGSSEPRPANPMMAPHCAKFTPIWSINSGMRGRVVIAANPCVKKITKSANLALFSRFGSRRFGTVLLLGHFDQQRLLGAKCRGTESKASK